MNSSLNFISNPNQVSESHRVPSHKIATRFLSNNLLLEPNGTEIIRTRLNLFGRTLPLMHTTQAHPVNFAQCYLRYFDPSCWEEAYRYFKCAPSHAVLQDHYEDFLLELNETQLQLQQIHSETECLDIKETVPGFYHVELGSLFSPMDLLNMPLREYYAGFDPHQLLQKVPLISLQLMLTVTLTLPDTAINLAVLYLSLAAFLFLSTKYPRLLVSTLVYPWIKIDLGLAIIPTNALQLLLSITPGLALLLLSKVPHNIRALGPTVHPALAELPVDPSPTPSPHLSDAELEPSVPKCPSCGRQYKDRRHERNHKCNPVISPTTQNDALQADIALKQFLAQNMAGIPSNRQTVIISFLQSASAQVQLAQSLGFVWPQQVSGSKLSLHGISTLLEASLHQDPVLKQQMYYYYQLELEYYKSRPNDIPPLIHQFMHPTVMNQVKDFPMIKKRK